MSTSIHGRAGRIALAAALALVLLAPAPNASAVLGPTSGCVVDPVSAQAQRAGLLEFTEDPLAGEWTTWFVDVEDLMPPAPPAIGSAEHLEELAELKQAQLARTDDEVDLARSFDTRAASSYWTDLMIHLIIAHSAKDGTKNPPRLARQFAMLEMAMYDALVVTWAAKYCYERPAPSFADPTLLPVVQARDSPSYPSEHAAVAGVIQVMLPVFFPPDEEPLGFDPIATLAIESRVNGGGNYRSDVEAGAAIGRAVAHAVLAARSNDGAYDSRPVEIPTGPCVWQPTPPEWKEYPVEPRWGQVTPFLMSHGAQFRAPPPPACGSIDFDAQTRDIYEASLLLTPRQKKIAEYWAGGQGTETPPGMWLWVGYNKTIEYGLTTMHTSRVMSHTAASLGDAAIAAWDTKYAYWLERPVTTIRATLDPNWSSYIITPPFPGYISGHSTFAGAATTTLAYFFPEDEVELSALATEAAMSRFYGGIHIRADNEVGLQVGSNVGSLAVAHAQLDE